MLPDLNRPEKKISVQVNQVTQSDLTRADCGALDEDIESWPLWGLVVSSKFRESPLNYLPKSGNTSNGNKVPMHLFNSSHSFIIFVI
ncbi:hypothetical protein RIR_jg27071.t1 [Rhizophagus irregularis DAOM 181602=DAOM 197198]|nr:hypothetical protein RIR_jg27071.t1 [Rhizophagus irregularis DAOM 181602=DAOM 197198]